MKFPQYICITMIAVACGLISHAKEANKPNVILIVADDLGWRDLGTYGSELYQTPHIDELAASGMRFSNAYAASPLCSPTRASLLTGQTPARLRFTTPVGHLPQVILDPQENTTAPPGLPAATPQTRSRLPLDTPTIARILEQAGYKNAFMGKWHLGFEPYIPENFGFDEVVCGRGFPGPPPPGFFGPWDTEKTNMPLVDGNAHADDVLGDEAVRFISENKETPFFLALWFFGVHAPFQAKTELIEKYRPLAQKTEFQKSAIMGGMIETVDDNVGKVIAQLEALNLHENTLVIFTSDNGGNMYDRPEGVNPTSNHPLQGGKGNNYEGGSRVPFIASWPTRIAPSTTNDTIAISYDIFPTLTSLLGLSNPEDHHLDGVDLSSSFLEGLELQRPPIYSLFAHTVLATGNIANAWIRDGDWKLLRFFNATPDQSDYFELYNLTSDIGETTNLASSQPETAQRLAEQLDAYLQDSGALLARPNESFDPDFSVNGFKVLSGGYPIGGPKDPQHRITAKASSLVASYSPPQGLETAEGLRLTVRTNCATQVLAAAENLYGSPIKIRPNWEEQQITIPFTTFRPTESVILSFKLEQPGRIFVSNIELIQHSHGN
ncbi:sulfatase [Pelagicoccus sp. SDUM812005]|uniref:sulfatase n=1 Tax=Pelagicoccus sp. SDUM812005 TaxID=3041257 RepID=UPI00280D24E1|nr:sulfatase [Pelagicoccus sp. SDUM812005]MDQ8181158.1 sulfatase [Pelagicoccus sp. SDUM812005]